MKGISQIEAVMPETLVVLNTYIIVMMKAALMAVVTTAVEMGVV